MQFKYPEILFALFLLLIPIIVHLFQLRRFKKEIFTNVKFLKRVQLQTRKSSQLKKWLTLLARLLALAAIIIAFAQPFIPHSDTALKDKETIVYIDNSFSMQQKSERGELMKDAVQQLLQTLPGDQSISVLTNDNVFKENKLSELKNELLQLDYSSTDATFKTIAIKANNLFSKNENTTKQFVAISDFQTKDIEDSPKFNPNIETDLIQLKGKKHINFSIDSVYFKMNKVESSDLYVNISASRPNSQSLSVSLYDGDQLLAKSSAGFDQDTLATTVFSLPGEHTDLEGRIEIEDNSLRFDNSFYFSLQKPKNIKVVSLNSDEESGEYLKKIFKHSGFEFTGMNATELDYNKIETADFVVLNELKQIPNGLENILKEHLEKGGYVTIIPAAKIDLESYNKLLAHLQMGQLSDFNNQDLKITTINFGHPLYNNVFDGKVTNFEYPSVEGFYNYTGLAHRVLTYNNDQGFLVNKAAIYLFTAPLDKEYSNFKRSPLIVPTFYNMGKQSLQLPRLFYTIGKQNTIEIPTELGKDEVLHLQNNEEDFIPQQQRFSKKVMINTGDLPEKSGTYQILKKGESVGHISFNYDRAENSMNFADMSTIKGAEVRQNVAKFFTNEINKNQISRLWKWFVIFALIFLLIEVAILKFLK